MKCPPYHLLKFIRPDVAWHRRRLLSSVAAAAAAAARDQSAVSGKTRKRVPKAERKAMVLDYVNKYRMENAGKFPGAEDTMNQVGGSYYTIRAILQELKHNCDLSAVVTTDSSSLKEPAAQRNNVFAVTEISDSAIPLHKIVEPEKYADLSENGINCLGKIDNDRPKQVVTRSRDTNLEDICVNQTALDSRLESPVDISASGTSCSVFFEREKSSAQAPESTMATVLDPATAKRQDDKSTLPAVEIIKETSIMGQTAEADEISEARETLDRQVTMDMTTITSNGGVSDETGPTSHGKLKTSHGQMNLDMSGVAVDKSNSVKNSANESVKAFETENSQFCENIPYSSRVISGASDTTSGDAITTSPPGSAAGRDSDTRSGDAITTSPPGSVASGDSRGTTTQKTDEKEVQGTLWGDLKSMASRFISIWR
ncbi:hypothetical protein vseg_000397 [Gypsophila vaccaria]